jgi:predicted nucleic acid-binding Zn ribbon protein
MKYTFRCRKCGQITMVEHGFDEPHPVKCDKIAIRRVFTMDNLHWKTVDRQVSLVPQTRIQPCGGELVRIFDKPNVVYRGSGFYATDKWQYEKEDDE